MSNRRLWWASFVDPTRPPGERFLGGCIIRSPFPTESSDPRADLRAVLRRAHLLGINPGGEVQALPLPPTPEVEERWVERLLSRAEIDELDRELKGQGVH